MYRKKKQYKIELSLFKSYKEFSEIVKNVLNITAKEEIDINKTINTYIIKAKIYNEYVTFDRDIINLISLYPLVNIEDKLRKLFQQSKYNKIEYIIIEINNEKF
uniref:Uncharacterized protein n=1 Tax=Clonostachys rogersoniana TaxID=122658 RepID=A0A8F1Y2H8_CLORO|nr:hypothetical protein [Clonostachys rogersoniana]